MATTTNYGWTTPDDTALVKDGASAIRSLGTSVDTTTKALNPSTTLGDIEYRSSTANTNTRLGIGSTGQVLTVAGGVPSWANAGSGFVGASVYDSTTQSVSNNTSTLLTWNTEYFDTSGFHDTSTNTGRMTIPAGKAGYYLCTANVNGGDGSTGVVFMRLRKNGVEIQQLERKTATNQYPQVTGTFIVNLAEADYVDCVYTQTSGSARDVDKTAGFGFFSIQYLGA